MSFILLNCDLKILSFTLKNTASRLVIYYKIIIIHQYIARNNQKSKEVEKDTSVIPCSKRYTTSQPRKD